MTDTVDLALGRLDNRARAEMPGADRISLRDFAVDVEIGAFEVERGVTQRLIFSAVVAVSPAPDAADDVDRILSYDTIAEAIRRELAAERLALLETLAERIAVRLLAEPQAQKVWLRIEKTDRGPGALGVEVVRSSGTDALKPVRPVVVYLGALDAPAARRWLAFLTDAPHSVLVCSDVPVEAVRDEPTRRVALLARDAAAWQLSALQPASHVAASRTEIDWALSQGHLTVWAPGKLLLDTPGAPRADAPGAMLAGWLADVMGAGKLVIVGEDPPADVTTPSVSVESETLTLG